MRVTACETYFTADKVLFRHLAVYINRKIIFIALVCKKNLESGQENVFKRYLIFKLFL